jgi:hypothetical protein
MGMLKSRADLNKKPFIHNRDEGNLRGTTRFAGEKSAGHFGMQ